MRVLVCVLRLYVANPGWGVGVCVFVCALRLYPANLGWGVRCGCCWVRVLAAPCHSWLRCWGVCVCVRAPPVPRQSWLWFVLCVCWFGFWLSHRQSWLGCWALCVCVRVPLVPRHSWLGCAVWVFVLGFGFRLRPAIPGLGVGLCVFVCALRLYLANPGWGVRCGCSGAGFALSPPLLWLGCGVCVLVRVLCPAWVSCALRCCACSPGLRHPAAVVARHLVLRRGCGRRRASLACLVAPRWCAALRPVRLLSVRQSAFPSPWCLPLPRAYAPGFTGRLRGARGGRPRTGLLVPAAGPRRGGGVRLAPRRTRSGPRYGVVLGGSLWRRSRAACAAVVWCVWTRSLTRPVSRAVRLSTGCSAGAPGLFRVDAVTAPFGSEDATPGSRACVRVRAHLGRVGRAGLPGAFWCASPFPGAVLGLLLVCSAPSGLGLPCLWLLLRVPFVRPRCLRLSMFSGPGCLGPWCPGMPPPPPPPPPLPFFSSSCPSPPVCVLCFLFFSSASFVLFFFLSAVFCGVASCRVVLVVRCRAGLRALGCGVCWCVLLSPLCSGRASWCLRCVVWCALVVLALCGVLFGVRWRRPGRVSLPRAGAALLVCFVLLPCCAVLAACRCAWVLLRDCDAAPGLVVVSRLALVCVVLFSLVRCFAPARCAVSWCPPPPRPLCAVFCLVALWLVPAWPVVPGACRSPPPPPPVVVPCVVRFRASCRVVPWSVVWPVLLFAWCCVACLRWAGALAPRRPARCCAGSCCVVVVVLRCRVLLCSLLFSLPLFLAFPWCSGLFLSVWCSAVVRLAVWRGCVALRSCAGFCCAVPCGAVLCRGVSHCSVLCCLFRCGASVAPCVVCCCGVLLCFVLGLGTAAMGIVNQWAIRLQTSDFYGPSPPTPNTQAPHDRPPPPPPPNIRLVDKWKMGKYGTSENVRHGGKHSTPPRLFRIIKVPPPPPPDT